mmetsp:Transcript_16297/g.22857  ORF Transcript_16297/g.22857 Transcript_16297/m.22857 type:complete len:328 (-) Transcript_16297:516-1499(-)
MADLTWLLISSLLFGLLRGGKTALTRSSLVRLSVLLVAEIVKFFVSFASAMICDRLNGRSPSRRNNADEEEFKMVEYGEVPASSLESPSVEGLTQDDIIAPRPPTQNVPIMQILRESCSWYFIPALVSFVGDMIVLTNLQPNNSQIQRIMSGLQVLTIALLVSILKPFRAMYSSTEWAAIVLLMASIPILLASSIEAEEKVISDKNEGIAKQKAGLAILATLLISIYVTSLEYMFSRKSWGGRGVHAQNSIIFGMRSIFFGVALIMGDVPAGSFFQWDSEQLKLFFVATLDGLLLPQVVAQGGGICYSMAIVFATALFATTTTDLRK